MNPFGAGARHAGNAYARVAVETDTCNAGPHRLVAMLFEGLFDALMQARGAMRSGNVPHKCTQLGRAISILEEGLKGGLNLSEGGALARDLNDLYDYAIRRLVHANLRNDEQAIDECVQLMQPLKSAWDAIGPQVEPPRAAP